MKQEEATRHLQNFLGDDHEIREGGDSEFYFIFFVDGTERVVLVRKEDGEVLFPNSN